MLIKITERCIEKKYKDGIKKEVVGSEDPLSIRVNDNLLAFRFYDQRTLVRDGVVQYVFDPINYTGWIYNGIKLSLKQIKETYPENEALIRNMIDNNTKYVCFFNNGGSCFMHDGDMTFDEYSRKYRSNPSFIDNIASSKLGKHVKAGFKKTKTYIDDFNSQIDYEGIIDRAADFKSSGEELVSYFKNETGSALAKTLQKLRHNERQK